MRGCFIFTALLAAAAAIGYAPLRKWAGGHVNPFDSVDLTGKTVIVTGANTGIGIETVKQLYRQNAKVVMACRSAKRCEGAMNSIQANVTTEGGSLETSLVDLNDMASVRDFAGRWGDRPLHILINNAGIMALPEHTVSDTGVEMQMNVNHMGHFLLTGLLLPALRASAPSRVVAVSSRAAVRLGQHLDVEDLGWAKRDYNLLFAYGASKVANILHARELTRLMGEEGVDVTAYSLHPGVIHTELMRNVVGYHWSLQVLADYVLGPLFAPLLKTPFEGAQTTLYAATAPHLLVGSDPAEGQPLGKLVPGAYYDNCQVVPEPNPILNQEGIDAALWKASEAITGWSYAAPGKAPSAE